MDYEEIAKSIDAASVNERQFMFYYLLGEYIDHLDMAIKSHKGMKTVEEAYMVPKMAEHKRACSEMRQVLMSQIF